ncbi:MAG: hypothetical protein JNM76_10070 [Betaproteobacteria bacterium]|nr:hypothetical protein [Betaproteobacteria bacterium]
MGTTIVVDQNVMQRDVLLDFIAKNPESKFVIPDTGLLEMVKSEQWESTFRRSFAAFVPVVGRCFMSMSIQEARDLELERRESAIDMLLPDDFTKMLRGAIAESQTGNGSTMDQLRARMVETRSELCQHELNPQANREELWRLVNELRDKLPEDQIKACRRGGTPARAARVLIAQSVGDAVYGAHMRNVGAPPDLALGLWQAKSVTRRWCYLLVHHALQWLGDGGLDSAPDKVVVNDILDQDYVLLGSIFDGVLSLETDVNLAIQDLTAMLALPPSASAPVGAV